MTITRTGALLIALYIAAVWVRGHSTEPGYPYFNGESATHFRVATSVAANGRLPAIDRRAFAPGGYDPIDAGPTGIEYITGQVYRVFSKFSDMSGVQFTRLWIALVFSLCVFACYAIARALWSCVAAGLFAASMAAFYPPLVFATDGREFLHGPFVTTIAAFGTAALVRWLKEPSTALALAGAAVTFALHATWEGAGAAAALVALIVLLSRHDPAACRPMLAGQLVAVLAAGILFPHLRAQHALAAWPAVLVAVCAVWFFAGDILPRRVHPLVYIAAATLVLGAFARGLAGTDASSAFVDYWVARIRFIFGKPDDPSVLSHAVRAMWAYRNAPPGWYGMVAYFLPLALLAPATVLGVRRFRAETRRRVGPAVVAAVVGAAAFLIDRSAVLAAPLCVVPLAGGAFFAFRGQWRARVLPVALALLVVAAGLLGPFSRLNPGYRMASALRGSGESESGFLWVSLGNADRELVRHLVSRTSVGDLFLAPPRIASLMVEFAGRRLLFVPGVGTAQAAERTSESMRLFYEDETRLYDECRSAGITYIVYSIDVLLDTSKYSSRYLAGLLYMPDGSVAWDMHFKPERLRHFTLAYENDNYRVFRVTEAPEPFFLTDHPPVYQRSILERYGDSLESFHRRIVDVLLTFAAARERQNAGDDKGAMLRFRYCVEQAPDFTRAWVGVGDTALRAGDLASASAAYTRALKLAPDDGHALYFGAVAVSRLGKREQALDMLEVLLNSTADAELRQEGLELKAYLESLGAPGGADS